MEENSLELLLTIKTPAASRSLGHKRAGDRQRTAGTVSTTFPLASPGTYRDHRQKHDDELDKPLL